MSFLGMDIEAALAHAATLEHNAANEIATLIAGIDPIMAELRGAWTGHDADRFHENWAANRGALNNLHLALNDLVAHLNQDIRQQRIAAGEVL